MPKYGGVLTFALSIPTLGFDEAYVVPWNCHSLYLTSEDLFKGDWTKGPAGTNEASRLAGVLPPPNLRTGVLAESWELTDPETMVYHIRKGVHWQDKPPVNGRGKNTVFGILYLLRGRTTR